MAATAPVLSRRAPVCSNRRRQLQRRSRLQTEVFGASSLLVRVADVAESSAMMEDLERQLTISLQLDESDYHSVLSLLPVLEEKAGRLLVNGFGTGVEVRHAVVHGGPSPATSDRRTTSVGTLAIRRILRPICSQDFPSLQPDAVRDGNPLGLWRQIDGGLGRH